MSENIKLLDATLRDGGQGLEDGYKNDFYDACFEKSDINRIIKLSVRTNVDIIELGCISPSLDDKSKFAIYKNIEELSKTIPIELKPNQMCVGLYTGPDTPVDNIPDWNQSLCQGLRVILRYSELQKSLDFCEKLIKKGYTVFVQPMLTMRYSDEELDIIINATNKMGAYALYFVDSYGYMDTSDIQRLFDYYNERLNKNVKIGFHAHNNMNLAYSNVQYFINHRQERSIIIDTCITGMGQGAGNMQTELLVPYMNSLHHGNYDYDSVLDLCEIIESKYIKDNEWGYSISRLLPAIHHCAYKYSMVLRKKYNLKYKEINNILSNMSVDMKQRYTTKNADSLFRMFKSSEALL